MKAYIIRRILASIPIVFGVMLVTFILFNVVGGDPAAQMAGKAATAEQIAEIRAEYGFDKPMVLNLDAARERGFAALFDSQLMHHFRRCLTFDFGRSFRDKRRISEIIARGALPSLSLTVPMFLIGLTLALSIALLVANARGTWLDRLLVVACVFGMSVPYLSYIMFGQLLLTYKLEIFPTYGYATGFEKIKYLALPVMIGVLSGLGASVRFYRTVMLDEIHADYVRTARAKGASTARVLFKHVLKNAMIPVITQVVLAIPFLFLGSLLLERFFGIPGLGYLMIDAINARDYPVISAMTFIGAMLYVAGLLVTDICYALVDPRVDLR